jgi:hypothetical protein
MGGEVEEEEMKFGRLKVEITTRRCRVILI